MTEPAGGRLDGRIALVTGASRGLGAAVARGFAAEGARLVLVARTTGGLEEVDDAIRAGGGLTPVLVPLDLADGEAVDRLGGALFDRYGRLDVLVGNAALLTALSPAHHIAPQDWQRSLDVNLTANWRLIRAMDPLLRQSPSGRAIFVTSGVTASLPPYWAAYAATKAALEALVTCWAGELAKTELKANLVDPGVLRTAMRARAFPGENPESLDEPSCVVETFISMAMPDWTLNGARIVAAHTREAGSSGTL